MWSDSETEGRRLTDVSARLGRAPRVLLAEDDDDVRWSLTALLLDRGYDVHSVGSGTELWEALEATIFSERPRDAPDVVITDVRMPGFNALGVLDHMRCAGWDGPALVISAFGDAQVRLRVEQMGGAEFFEKPLDLDLLEAAVEDAACGKGLPVR